MTLMLASVVDAAEAALALAGGADIIDFSDPAKGAVGSVSPETIRAVAGAAGRAVRLSAAVGPPPYEPKPLTHEARALIRAGAKFLRVAADADMLVSLEPTLAAIARETDLIGVLFADRNPDFAVLPRLAAIGFKGVLIDAAQKGGKRLLDHLAPPQIEAFCVACRLQSLSPWLAGSLQSPDVPRLLLLEPDVLGFRSALCARGRRDGPFDPRRIALIRGLIPPSPFPPGDGPAARRPGVEPSSSGVDVIFVHDFVMTAEIGAYAHERGATQRLLFNVDATVARIAAHADDMRAVVSYDIILDAIRIVIGRGHIEFLETIAEDVAAMALKHSRVREVRVRVEKLDIVAGSVGVEIRRGRPVLQLGRTRGDWEEQEDGRE